MKKILYLHGLESRVGGEKVEYLQHKYGIDNVLAPEMDYKTNPKLFTETLELVNTFKPDLIIGSSMGGYFAECLATNYPTEVLLFNPASINEIEYLQEYNINPTMGKHKLNGTAILGEYDDTEDYKSQQSSQPSTFGGISNSEKGNLKNLFQNFTLENKQ